MWDYFDFDDGKGKSICQVKVSGRRDRDGHGAMKCSAEIAGKFPTNLKAHLKGNHPAAYTQMMRKEAEKQKEKEATANKSITTEWAADTGRQHSNS